MVSLKDFMKLGGEKFEVFRNNEKISEVDGLPNHEEGTKRPYIGFYDGTDIKVGDWVKGKISNDWLYIEDIRSHIVNGKVFQIKGYYLTKKEFEEREQLKRKEKEHPYIIYNLYGANSRVINNSTDQSINVVDMSSKDLFDELRNTIQTFIEDEKQKRELREIVDEMEKNQGTNKFNQLYTKFITSAANHMTILSPFIPALSQMIQS